MILWIESIDWINLLVLHTIWKYWLLRAGYCICIDNFGTRRLDKLTRRGLININFDFVFLTACIKYIDGTDLSHWLILADVVTRNFKKSKRKLQITFTPWKMLACHSGLERVTTKRNHELSWRARLLSSTVASAISGEGAGSGFDRFAPQLPGTKNTNWSIIEHL